MDAFRFGSSLDEHANRTLNVHPPLSMTCSWDISCISMGTAGMQEPRSARASLIRQSFLNKEGPKSTVAGYAGHSASFRNSYLLTFLYKRVRPITLWVCES